MRPITLSILLLACLSSVAQDITAGITTLLRHRDSLHRSMLSSVRNRQRTIIQPHPQGGIDVAEVKSVPWGENGIQYLMVPGENLGVTSFSVADSTITLLSNSSNEVITLNKSTSGIHSRFRLSYSPLDIAADKDRYYILGDQGLSIYSGNGEKLHQIGVDSPLLRNTVNIYRKHDSTFANVTAALHIPLESNSERIGNPALTDSNFNPAIDISADTTYLVTPDFHDSDHGTYSLTTHHKVAAVYLIYSDAKNLILDEQTWLSQAPISVERHLVWIVRLAHPVVARLKIPNCYYVRVTKDFVYNNGAVYQLLTSPEGARIFKLTFNFERKGTGYPGPINSCQYHYNDHLLKEQ